MMNSGASDIRLNAINILTKHILIMRKLIVLAATLALASLLFFASQGQHQLNTFAQWQKDFNLMLDLSPSELAYRQRVFEENLKKIEAHNALPGKTYQMGVNQFTAYTQAEFEAIFLSKMEVAKIASLEEVEQKVGINIDWVSAGAVSPVKNQGSCGATYAFSAIGGIEGLAYVTYKTQTEYSVQQLIDCSQSYGNSGCNSGNMVNSYNYIKAKGIQTEVAYPFTGVVGACKFSSGLFKISGAINVGTCTALESALLTRPVPVAVDGQNFASYRSGIFDNCGRSHSLAALLVGATDQYYRVKNSWGTTWGEAGYIRLSRTNNICGICEYGTYPLA